MCCVFLPTTYRHNSSTWLGIFVVHLRKHACPLCFPLHKARLLRKSWQVTLPDSWRCKEREEKKWESVLSSRAKWLCDFLTILCFDPSAAPHPIYHATLDPYHNTPSLIVNIFSLSLVFITIRIKMILVIYSISHKNKTLIHYAFFVMKQWTGWNA